MEIVEDNIVQKSENNRPKVTLSMSSKNNKFTDKIHSSNITFNN
jgi:hypothetical protein